MENRIDDKFETSKINFKFIGEFSIIYFGILESTTIFQWKITSKKKIENYKHISEGSLEACQKSIYTLIKMLHYIFNSKYKYTILKYVYFFFLFYNKRGNFWQKFYFE